MMRTIWLACCACGEYALVQREIEARDPGAQVLRVGDLDGLVSMTRAFPSRRGSALIVCGSFDAGEVRRCVARLAAEGRCARVTVLVDELEPGPIGELFRAGATEVVAARSVLAARPQSACESAADDESASGPVSGLDALPPFDAEAVSAAPLDMAEGCAGERDGGCVRKAPDDPRALSAEGVGSPRATGGPRAQAAVTEHERRPCRPEPSCGEENVPCPAPAPSESMGYVHGVNLAEELDEAPGFDMQPTWQPASVTGDLSMAASRARSVEALGGASRSGAEPAGPRAPVVCAISGRGGCGKSTIVATMAHAASLLGLRAAVLDLDLMFGNLYDLMGVDAPVDMAALIEPAAAGALSEESVVAASMRIAPGVTLWGPVALPERAELMARPVELLLDLLRRESDVVFVDTSVFWGDAVAAAVAQSDRCLVVGDPAVSSAASAQRAIDLACRLGVPRTRMTSVFNRFGARGADEDVAMRYELTCALGSKVRIADGGGDLSALMSFGRADEAVGQTSAFAKSVREATREMLVELGCAVGPWSDVVADPATRGERPRMRLPWRREGGAR